MEAGEGSRTLGRAVALLRAVATSSPEPRKLAELAEESGLHRATAHRLLAALGAEGLIDTTSGGYVLGPTCWALGLAAQPRFDITEIVRPSLQRIADETGDVGLFSVRIGAQTRCICRVEGHYPILPTSVREGSTRPLGVGGHALAQLAALEDDEIAVVLAKTHEDRKQSYPVFTDAYLGTKVAETRRQGYASAEGEIIAGWGGLALPVRDRWGKLLGAISFIAISDRISNRRAQILDILNEERRRIETALGAPQTADGAS